MVWHTSLKSSLFSLFGGDSARVGLDRADRLERVRTEMLKCLQSLQGVTAADYLDHRVRHATDVQSLWYLRSDLMGLLCSTEGETAARAHLDRITRLFKGLLPKGLASRSNRLGS
jgi:hypothetical protein